MSSIFNDRRGDRERFERDRDDWSQAADKIRDDWWRRDRNDLPFRHGWWDSHRVGRWPAWGPWGYARWQDRPYYWWGWTPANRLVTWLAFDWNRPRYWNYGPGYNIWYQDGYVYYDGDRYLPVNDYYQRIYDLAHSVPQIDPNDAEGMEWSPLGVFAVMRQAESNEAGQKTIQLAINREGVLSGTYYNSENGHVHPLSGMVDDHNQRAAWAFSDGEHPKTVFETSLFNLTKDQSTMMVHFGPDENDTEVWHVVRLEHPESGQANGAAADRRNNLP